MLNHLSAGYHCDWIGDIGGKSLYNLAVRLSVAFEHLGGIGQFFLIPGNNGDMCSKPGIGSRASQADSAGTARDHAQFSVVISHVA
jgi:hypothetical protein